MLARTVRHRLAFIGSRLAARRATPVPPCPGLTRRDTWRWHPSATWISSPRRALHTPTQHVEDGNVKSKPLYTARHVTIQEFRERAERGVATVEDAKSCVLHHHAALNALPSHQRHQRVKDSAIGGQVLSWLWEHPPSDNNEVYTRDFAEPLCWLLVVEGLEEYIWQWLMLEAPQYPDVVAAAGETGVTQSWQDFNAWTGRVLAALAAAHLDLAPYRTANEAIKRWLRAVAVTSKRGAQSKSFALAQLYTTISRALMHREAIPCDVRLFDGFRDTLRFANAPRHVPSRQAELSLYHPTQPDAQELLRLTRERDWRIGQAFDATTAGAAKGRNSLASNMLRAAYILRLQRQDDGARYLEAVVERENPIVSQKKDKIYESLEEDLRLEQLRNENKQVVGDDVSPLDSVTPSEPSVSFAPFAHSTVKTSGHGADMAYDVRSTPETIVPSLAEMMAPEADRLGPLSEATALASSEIAAPGITAIESAKARTISHYESLSNIPLGERRTQCQEAAVGDSMLSWLLDQPRSIQVTLCKDRGFAASLCWSLVGEGKEVRIWDWLLTEATALPNGEGRSDMPAKPGCLMWMAPLLAGLVGAHKSWAVDGHPDKAVNILVRALDISRESKSNNFLRYIGAAQIYVATWKVLLKPGCPPCNPLLFDRVVGAASVFAGPDRVPVIRARCALFHPTRPDGVPLLRLMQAAGENLDVLLLHHARPIAQNKMAHDLLRAAYILRLQGMAEDAEWIEAVVRQKSPVVWSAAPKILCELEQDPKLVAWAHTTVAGKGMAIRGGDMPASSSTTLMFWHRRPLRVVSPGLTTARTYHTTSNRSSDDMAEMVKDFEHFAYAGTASTEDAQRCLQRLQDQLKRMPMEQRKTKCKELAAGGKVLRWLWDD